MSHLNIICTETVFKKMLQHQHQPSPKSLFSPNVSCWHLGTWPLDGAIIIIRINNSFCNLCNSPLYRGFESPVLRAHAGISNTVSCSLNSCCNFTYVDMIQEQSCLFWMLIHLLTVHEMGENPHVYIRICLSLMFMSMYVSVCVFKADYSYSVVQHNLQP